MHSPVLWIPPWYSWEGSGGKGWFVGGWWQRGRSSVLQLSMGAPVPVACLGPHYWYRCRKSLPLCRKKAVKVAPKHWKIADSISGYKEPPSNVEAWRTSPWLISCPKEGRSQSLLLSPQLELLSIGSIDWYKNNMQVKKTQARESLSFQR